MYAKIINGVLEYAPNNYKLNDGRVIVGFNKSVALMTRYGYKEVVDEKPDYDPNKEYLVMSDYAEQEKAITIIYSIKQMDMIEQELTIDEKIAQLQATDTEHELAIAELMDTILGGEQ